MAKKQTSIVLAPTEWEIMKVFWARSPLAARDVFAALPQDNSWAYKTVKTLLARLVAKGALIYDEVGNSYLYRPAVEREQMTRQEVRSLFERIRGMTLSPLLAHFIEEAHLNEEEIAELRKVLDAKQKLTSSRAKNKKEK